jgi:hypothetical protein
VLVTGDACHNRSIFDVLTTVHMYITVFGLWRRAVWYTGTFRPTPRSICHRTIVILYGQAMYATSARSNPCTPSEPSRWNARSFTVQSVATTLCIARFNIHKVYILPVHCSCMLCADLKINSDSFPVEH